MAGFIIFAVLLTATYTDLKHNKIHNKLIFPVLIVGLIYQSIQNKTLLPYDALLGFVLPLILIPFFALNMIGAGDVKLYMAVGVWLGFASTASIMVYSILAGGIVALGIMLVRKNGSRRIRYFILYVKSCMIALKPLPYQDFDDAHQAGRFPYAVVIFLGYCVYLILGKITV